MDMVSQSHRWEVNWYIDVITVHNCNLRGWATTIFKRQIFLSVGVQLEAELAWRWWGALVASVFSRRPNSRSFFHWLRLTFSRAECFNTNCNAGCGLFAPWRRGSRVSEELGLLPHQVADDRDLEGSSDPEKVSQPRYFKELPRWEVGPWQFKQDLTLLSWWIC